MEGHHHIIEELRRDIRHVLWIFGLDLIPKYSPEKCVLACRHSVRDLIELAPNGEPEISVFGG